MVFFLQNLTRSALQLNMLKVCRALGLCRTYQDALVASICRVDHAGEMAADQIYRGQHAVLKSECSVEDSLEFRASFTDSAVGPVIKEMWEEEKEHLDICERLLAKHDVNPTVFSPLFSALALGLGENRA